MQPTLPYIEEKELATDGWEIPNDWQQTQLCKVISRIEAGTSVNAEDSSAQSHEIAVLKVSCVSDGRFFPKENKKVTASDVNRVRTPVTGGTLIISRSNTPNLVGAYVSNSHSNLFHSDKLWQVHANESVTHSKYLAYLITSPDTQRRISKMASGSSPSMKNISQDRFLKLAICLPSLREQACVVAILDAADAAIHTTEHLIEAKTRYKRVIAEQLLTGKRRFPEFKGHAWRHYSLGQLFSERIEMNRSDLKLLAVTGTDGIVDRNSLVKRDTSSEDKSKCLRVAPGDIAYNTMRMWQGVFGLSTLEGIVSPAYTVCTPNERVDGPFAAFLFKLPAVISLFQRHSQGLVSDTLNCKFPSFSKIKVTIPAIPEQRKIAEVLGLVDEEIALLRRELDALKRQKQGLMQKLLTGQVRV